MSAAQIETAEPVNESWWPRVGEGAPRGAAERWALPPEPGPTKRPSALATGQVKASMLLVLGRL